MPVPDQAYRAALLAADDRERLILRMGAEVGMRRAEVAQAHSRDLVEDLTGWSIVAHGKGGRDRLLPLPDSLAAALRCGDACLHRGEHRPASGDGGGRGLSHSGSRTLASAVTPKRVQ